MDYNLRKVNATIRKMWWVNISITLCNLGGLGFSLADYFP